MFVLAIFLTVKYILFDDHIEEEVKRKLEEASQIRSRQLSDSTKDSTSQTTSDLQIIPQDDTGIIYQASLCSF